jgi:PAS domain S-box-containing protein
METDTEQTPSEITRLKACINDLISVLALPAIWSGHEASLIVSTLLDVLLGMLRVDFAYLRLKSTIGDAPIEMVRVARQRTAAPHAQEIGRALAPWLATDSPASPFVVPNPVGQGKVSIALLRLGLQDEVGVLVAGAQRRDFPSDVELVLLRVAANQAWIGLQQARRTTDQNRAAHELEQRVVERTRQLTAVNEELQRGLAERKRAEEELRRSEAYLAEAQRLSHTGSFGWDVFGGEIFWSEETFRIFGYEDGTEPTPERILQRTHPDDRVLVQRVIDRAQRDRKEFDVEHRLLMPDGSVKYLHVVAHPLKTNEAGKHEFVGAVMDITDRKRAEYLTGQVFERSPDDVFIIARDFRYQRVNPVYEHHWRKPAEKIVGMHVADLLGMESFEQMRPYLDRCFEGEEVSKAGWLTFGSRARRYVAVSCSPLRPYSERVEAALVISRDLTEHMLASEALREAQAALAHVTRVTTLGEVTASIAHELNQPLAAIANNANACLGLLPSGRHDVDDVREALTDMVSDAGRASAIIERVRGLAKRSSPEKVPLRLADVVDDVLALAAAESVARRVAIRTDVAADLPVVLGDRVQLQQVLLNLVVNAMDAMSSLDEPERRLEIRGRADREHGAPAATISVQDRGIGLDTGQMDRLFEAFYTTKSHGMGMGLAISRSIIEGHGGRLWAEPNQGPGATFSFRLPVGAAHRAAS